jgi:Holliday junction DNA helicase RuvA
MIAMLRGTMVSRDGSRAVIDVRDVGYAIIAAAKDLDSWTSAGGAVTVHVCTDVREDAITLYGFADDVERVAFERLRVVNGVGPKVALASLDTLGLDGLAVAIAGDDLRALAKIPGVGKKLAQRLALELKGKLPVGLGGGSPLAPTSSLETDALDLALAQWGYSKAEIERAQAALTRQGLAANAPLPERLRAALRVLSAR